MPQSCCDEVIGSQGEGSSQFPSQPAYNILQLTVGWFSARRIDMD